MAPATRATPGERMGDYDTRDTEDLTGGAEDPFPTINSSEVKEYILKFSKAPWADAGSVPHTEGHRERLRSHLFFNRFVS